MTPTERVSDPVADHRVRTSFGLFKPIGHVMVGVPGGAQIDALATALHGAGWDHDALLHFDEANSVAELEHMVDGAGALVGFGYEIALLRRYLELARQGYRFLLVKVDNTDRAAAVAELARAHGATLAVHYRTLLVEELI